MDYTLDTGTPITQEQITSLENELKSLKTDLETKQLRSMELMKNNEDKKFRNNNECNK